MATTKDCGWCKQPSLQAICMYCNAPIYIVHNSVDCSWSHRGTVEKPGYFACDDGAGDHMAWPKPSTIEPSSTDDIPKPANVSEYPALVLATSKRAGRQYADMLGLKNYRVVREQYEIEGAKARAVVVTPAYYQKMEESRHYALNLFHAAVHAGTYTNAPRG